MYAPVLAQDDESKEIDLLLDPVVKHLVTVVLQLNETDSQYQFLEQNGYLRDLISLTDFPITSPMQDRYIPPKESGRFSGDPQYLIRGIALNLQKFRLWVDYVISQSVDKNNVTWTDLGAQDFQDFKLKFRNRFNFTGSVPVLDINSDIRRFFSIPFRLARILHGECIATVAQHLAVVLAKHSLSSRGMEEIYQA